jgi:oligopeptide transport system permease protein
MGNKQKKKSVQELEAPVVKLDVNYNDVDTEPDKSRPLGRKYPKSRHTMPEKQLFEFAEYKPQEAERIGYSNYSYWKSVWANFLKKKSAVFMSIVFILLFAFTFVASAIGKYDINMAPDPLKRAYIEPNAEFWFGTNAIGQDYWAQVWYATRASILLAVLVSIGQVALGVLIGLVWGYVRKLDRFFTELYNLIDNIPTIIYMTLIALMVGKSMLTMGIAMVGFGWLATARNVRNLVFMYRDREYNLASRCLGTKLYRILFRNIFPYLVSVIILRLALAIPGTIAYETTLTYLGLMDITKPSLGMLLSAARAIFPRAAYTLWIPAAIVSIITITFYLVGNAFSDACDPRNHV